MLEIELNNHLDENIFEEQSIYRFINLPRRALELLEYKIQLDKSFSQRKTLWTDR